MRGPGVGIGLSEGLGLGRGDLQSLSFMGEDEGVSYRTPISISVHGEIPSPPFFFSFFHLPHLRFIFIFIFFYFLEKGAGAHGDEIWKRL